MIKEVVAWFLLFSSVLCAQSTPSNVAAVDRWKALRFLIGTWKAKTQGGSAAAASSGSYTFQLELHEHVLARQSRYVACKGPTEFDCDHGDLLYVYEESTGTPLKAIYFDSEGHVIHYDVIVRGGNEVEFVSSATQPGPQFRLVYELTGTTMRGKFQIRMPGQSDFKSYLEWSGDKETDTANH